MSDSTEQMGDPSSHRDMFNVAPVEVAPETLHYLLEPCGVRYLGDTKVPAAYELPFADGLLSAAEQLEKHLEDPVATLLLLGGSRLHTSRMADMIELFKNKPILHLRRSISDLSRPFPFANGYVRLDKATGQFSFARDPQLETTTISRAQVTSAEQDSLTVIDVQSAVRITARMQNQKPEILQERLVQLSDEDQQWFMQLHQAFAQYQDRMCAHVVAVLSEDETAVLRRAYNFMLPDEERRSAVEQAKEIVYSAQATHNMFDADARDELLTYVRNIQFLLLPYPDPEEPLTLETLGSRRVKVRVSRYFTMLIAQAASQTPPSA